MSGFDIGNSVNSCADYMCTSPLIRNVMENPLYTALLLTALACIIFMSIYYDRIKSFGTNNMAKGAIYLFLSFLLVTFLHHYAVGNALKVSRGQKDIQDVFSSIEVSRSTNPGVEVVPKYLDNSTHTGGDDDGIFNINDVLLPISFTK